MIRESLLKHKNRKDDSFIKTILSMFLLFVFILMVSIMIGRYRIQPSQVWTLLLKAPRYILKLEAYTPQALVIYNVRLPRIILAATVGAVLSGTGLLFQGVFKNPLASPDILGVTAGCSFGAALAILLPIAHPYSIQLSAFVFGLASVFMTYSLARLSRNKSVIMLVLSGMVVASFFTAALSFLKYVSDPYEQLPAIVFWIMGGFYKASWENTLVFLISTIPFLVFLVLISWKINIISLGDQEASILGVNVKRIRFLLLIMGSFMVANSVSLSGSVTWVALVIPHITRLIIGPNHKQALPLALIIGGSFTLLLDDIARTLTASEIPISILTAAFGAPLFGYILLRKKGFIG